MSKLVVMLRVKDGKFWLDEWLACYEKIADEIVVLDNDSTDGTFETLQVHPKVSSAIRTTGYNEGRDKIILYNEVRKRNPDWCIWVDVDEIFEPGLTRKHFDKLMKNSLINKYAFRRFHFVDETHFAGSKFRLNYSSGHDRLMWRESPTAYFENFIIDSPNVKGIKGIKMPTHFRLKHLGYINKDIVDQKAALYRTIIPGKEDIFQEMYMRNEKAIRWNDDRHSFEVKALNMRLDLILLKNYFFKVVHKVIILFRRKKVIVQQPKTIKSSLVKNNENAVTFSEN